MDASKIEALNARYGIENHASFRERNPGIIACDLSFCGSSAEVSLYGAAVLSYRPRGGEELLFLSSRSAFEAGKPIRGGIPICWPWFGIHQSDPSLPPHGFLRLVEWDVASCATGPEGLILELRCVTNQASLAMWQGRFLVEYSIRLGKALDLEFRAMNTGADPWRTSGAFHPYFRVGDLSSVRIPEFDGIRYSDRVDKDRIAQQAGPLTISGELNRIYRTDGPASIVDRVAGRTIHVAQKGCTDFVAWNPGKEKCAAIPDLEAGDHGEFLCIEPAWLEPGGRVLDQGGTYRTGMSIEVESS